MGVGNLFSDVFGGNNPYQATQSPIMGRPRQPGETAEQYQNRIYGGYEQKMSDYEKQIRQAQGANIPKNVLDYAAANKTLGQNQQLIDQIMQQAQGQGPNPSLEQLKMTTGQNIANQAALMAGQRGVNPALAMRSAGQQGANLNQQAAAQAALQAAQQQLSAQQLGGNLLGQQAGLQAQMAGAQGQVGLGLMGARTAQEAQLRQAQVAYQNLLQNAYNSANNINAGVAAQNANTNMQYGMGVMGGLGAGLAGFLNKGGEVKGYAEGGEAYPKGHKKTDIVMSEFGKGQLKSSSGQKVTNPKQAIAIALSEQRRAEGKSHGGEIKEAYAKIPITKESEEGTQDDMSFVDAIRRQHLASGGISQYEAFQSGNPLQAELGEAEGQKGQGMMEAGLTKGGSSLAGYLKNAFAPAAQIGGTPSLMGLQGSNSKFGLLGAPAGAENLGVSLGDIGELAPLAAALSVGGKIPGKAKKDGDHEANDTVPAMLSPGEVVIPRSALDSQEDAHAFLDQILKKKKIRSYGDVLRAQHAIKAWGGYY